MKILLSILLFVCYAIDPESPQADITNGIVRTTVYLPDPQQGYYRGTRFDWSGAFKSLDYDGHHYVEPWFEKYDPKTHDAISGPAEEFTALGFTDAKPGETFVKIGVGVLRKPDDKPYAFAQYYDVVDHGKWDVKTAKDHVDFQHELTDANGYGYRYTKTVRLTKDKPELVLEHRLKNTGKVRIETSVYDHNFFIIDGQPTGPAITVRFPFAVKAEGKGFGSVIYARDSSLVYGRELEKKEQVYSAGLQGFGATADAYDIRIENLKTGAGLRATSDQPLEKLVFWACSTTSCPEPYVRLRVMPGQEATWKIRYAFYQKKRL